MRSLLGTKNPVTGRHGAALAACPPSDWFYCVWFLRAAGYG